jgi:hypothetical protein
MKILESRENVALVNVMLQKEQGWGQSEQWLPTGWHLQNVMYLKTSYKDDIFPLDLSLLTVFLAQLDYM